MEATRSPGAGGSYARKAQLADERKRLLTDRNAYIAYLENQVERSNTALLEVEAAASDLRLLRGRVDDLEEKLQSSSRTWELVQAQSVQMHEAGAENAALHPLRRQAILLVL
ncbi:unnamed protein product [Symbiodinium natans]|uniref:Uncharacterized protein n=1 Tax=Symbiodinium natans TaxID=878477 RepID=A0A812KFT7_9DINO|nr:unnamed protein product [Symbiodinium natans]